MDNATFPTALPLRMGRLLPGYVSLEDGVNAPLRGIVDTDDGEMSAIVKKLGSRTLAVEILCAVYGRSIGLPIPEPLIVFDEDLGWLFGSLDVGHPNLSKFVSISSLAIREKLIAWPGLISAACFDELIVNGDRHDGNILFDGIDFTLIDHDMCLPYGMNAADSMPSHHSNILLDMLIAALPEGDLSKRKLINESNAWIAQRSPSEAGEAGRSIVGVCTDEHQDRLVSFVNERLNTLADLVLAKVNPEQGRLNV